MNLYTCIERKEPRSSDGRDQRSILHLEKNERRSLTVVVGKVTGLGLQICQNGLDGRAEPPAFAAAFPNSTGMLTFSKNLMIHLLTVWVGRAPRDRV